MIVFVLITAFAAFLVSSVAGGGAGLVLVPILRLVVPIAGVPAALSIGTAASSLSRIAVFRSSVRWDVVVRFVPTALPAAALGAWLLSRFEPAYVEFIIGCFLLANLPALLRRTRAASAVSPLPPHILPALGASAGLLSGLTGAVGLLFNNFYRRLGMTPREIIATRATNEVLLHLLKLVLYCWFGLLSGAVIAAGLVVAVAAIAASIAARWLVPLLHEAVFRRIGHGAMVAAGCAMFTLSGTQIAVLHQAWVTHVAPGGENELQFHWNGTRVAALEWEPEGYPAFERTVKLDALPRHERAALLAIAPRDAIVLVEQVHTPHARYLEVYWRRGDRIQKDEVTV